MVGRGEGNVLCDQSVGLWGGKGGQGVGLQGRDTWVSRVRGGER